MNELEKYKRALYVIDMVNGFVKYGAMSNENYKLLIKEQLRVMNDFRGDSINFIGEGHRDDSLEFKSYPAHCILGSGEEEFISEHSEYLVLPDSRVYRKNSINGMFNTKLLSDINHMKNLKEVVFMGVCEDLCVMDFVRSYARYMDEINRDVSMFVVGNCTDTFDSDSHNRDMWKGIARKVIEQAGVIYVDDYEELKKKVF